METKESSPQYAETIVLNLHDRLEQLEAIEPEKFARREELGKYSFSDAIPLIERPIALFVALLEHNLEAVPTNKLESIISNIDNFKKHLEQFESFTLDESPPNDRLSFQDVRDRLVDGLYRKQSQYFDSVVPVLAFLRSGQDVTSEWHSERERIKTDLERTVAHIEQTKEELDTLLESSRVATAEIGVTRYEQIFDAQALEHSKNARWWLIATAVITAVTILYVFLLFPGLPLAPVAPAATESFAAALQQAIPRILLFSLLSFGIAWCAKNYRAHRHNQIVSIHRRNALRTFEVFVEATQPGETRDAVLLRATEAIFSPLRSGYLGNDPSVQSGSQILEIVRGGPGISSE